MGVTKALVAEQNARTEPCNKGVEPVASCTLSVPTS